MAETAFNFARDHVFPFLLEVTNMIRGIPKDVADMKKELENIQKMIYDADRMAALGDQVTSPDEIKEKVKLLIEVAFRMEDVIDEYMVSEENQPHDPRCVDVPGEIIKAMIHRLQITHQIRSLKSRICAINTTGNHQSDFHIQPFGGEGPGNSSVNQRATLEHIRKAPLYMDEAQIVGFDAPRDELVGWLTKGRTERTVISVVGMGGQGKTTLTKNVFDNKEVIGHFHCRVWITVSQSYTIDGLLKDLHDKIFKQSDMNLPFTTCGDALIEEVRNCLRQKRYVIVFDDVWDENFWDEIEFAALDNKRGSRILITTRSLNVAKACMKSSFVQIHELKGLSPEQSWDLFCKKTFQFSSNGCCPEELIDISSKIVAKCDGLPLAIVVTGGLLSRKDNTKVHVWERFYQELNDPKSPNIDSIVKILGMSYHHLPNHLKPCFLYFGIYPEDHEIKRKRLIWQWIVEGFVKYKEGQTLEQVAEEYLEELINRSLVQASSLNIEGRVKGCRIHDVTREMILGKIKDLNFCHNVYNDNSMLSGITQRLSLIAASDVFMSSSQGSHIRSLFVFSNEKLPESVVRRIPIKYMLLKILDFGYSRLKYFPENLGNLIHLRYLSLRNTQVYSLPDSIGKLQNLESLDVRGTGVRNMPKEITRLRKLRHLLGNRITLMNGIGGMTSLQTLHSVTIDEVRVEVMGELGRLTQLRKLSLYGVTEEQVSDLCSSIIKMQHLENLHIGSKCEHDALGPEFNSCPLTLRKLFLESMSKKLPDWIPKLQNLVKLTLEDFQFIDDPTKYLRDLKQLLFLSLAWCECERLHFQDGGFQNLKQLKIRRMQRLNSICISKGALLSLQSLILSSNPNLDVPSGIHHLKELQLLEVSGMPTIFIQNIAPIGGPEHPAILHVPLVKIYDRYPYPMPTRIIQH